ncbi:MAG TPA: 3-phosphoshikimate 1-carboxyvinyltransferase [Planktothrix sp.]
MKGILSVPGDKSISHRALMFAALSRGTVRITGLSPAEDCASTASCLRRLGLGISQPEQSARTSAMIASNLTVESPGLHDLSAPVRALYAGNSGTTMRIISGLVSGQSFTTTFDGDSSLRRRPMSRVLVPLSQMGMKVDYPREAEDVRGTAVGFAPFSITGGHLQGREFNLDIASAQVQTALLLAGLQAEGETVIRMPARVRDHTERMFKYIGIPFEQSEDSTIRVRKLEEPAAPFSLSVPGDLSSAAFFIVAAVCLPGSDLLLKSVGVNPGRRLILEVLGQMGAELNPETVSEVCGEPVADVRARYNKRLKGATVSGDQVPLGIDEIPVLALAGATCDGVFTVTGAAELRHKESDRLRAIVDNLRAAGVEIEELEDGFRIQGSQRIRGGSPWRTYGDHRLAMTALIANCIFEQPVQIEETDSIRISYPGFAEHLRFLVSE